MSLYKAKWFFPGDRPPIENAIVRLDEGCIHVVQESADAEVIDLGDVAITPALVNAHTHLEFSYLSEPLQPLRDFPNWIRSVVQSRAERTISTAESVRRGLMQVSESQTRLVGEIATSDWRGDVDVPVSVQVVMFREFYGLTDERVAECLVEAREFLSATPSQNIFAGLSPHAPYSVHPKLFDGLCDLAVEFDAPLAFHLAESPAELQLIRDGSGSLAESFKRSGFWRDNVFPQGTTPLPYIERLAELPKALIIHGNLLTLDEMEFIANHPNLSVVYCPRTHASMQQGDHPWKSMIDLGINVAIGTDSRASNPDLSIWNELRFLADQFPEVPASKILKLGTINGAKALGMTLNGMTVISLNEEAVKAPEASLFTGTPLEVY